MIQWDSRRHLSLLVIGLVILSGCSGFGGNGGETPTPTVTEPIPTKTPPPETPDNGVFAPGVSNTGITDSEALLSAHKDGLLADGAQIHLSTVRTAANGTTLEESTQTLQMAPNATSASVTGSGFGPSGTLSVDAWLNETTSLFRFQGDGDTEYRVLGASPGRTELVFAGNIGAYVRAVANVSTVQSIEERNGQQLMTLRAEADLVNETDGLDTEMEMTVDSSGIIRSFTFTQTQPDEERYHLEFTVQRTAVTVERPAWIDAVPAGVFLETDVSIESEDGGAVLVGNGGPDSIPAGARVTIVAGGVTYDATIPEALGAGEQRWIWVDAESGELRVGLERPSSDSVQFLGEQAVVEVRTNDGIRLASAEFMWRTGRDSR